MKLLAQSHLQKQSAHHETASGLQACIDTLESELEAKSHECEAFKLMSNDLKEQLKHEEEKALSFK